MTVGLSGQVEADLTDGDVDKMTAIVTAVRIAAAVRLSMETNGCAPGILIFGDEANQLLGTSGTINCQPHPQATLMKFSLRRMLGGKARMKAFDVAVVQCFRILLHGHEVHRGSFYQRRFENSYEGECV